MKGDAGREDLGRKRKRNAESMKTKWAGGGKKRGGGREGDRGIKSRMRKREDVRWVLYNGYIKGKLS